MDERPLMKEQVKYCSPSPGRRGPEEGGAHDCSPSLQGRGQGEGAEQEIVEVRPWQNSGYLVSSGGAAHQGLVIHGYGGNSTEMLGLAVDLASRLELQMLVFDLPGHGGAANVMLTRSAALASVKSTARAMGDPSFFIGHSLGARLGLEAGFSTGVLLSMPGPASFEGSRSDLFRTLRARRVNEPSPFQGLEEILTDEVEPVPKTFFLRAGHDLQSVKQLAAEWEKMGIACGKIKDSNHNDIVSSPETRDVVAEWLQKNLK